VFAPLTTVVNTFGGTWFDADWDPGVGDEPFREAVNFYVDLVREHGEAGAAQAGFAECLNNMTQGNVAMWYDATSAAGSLEREDSPVAGKIGYVAAPVVETDASGWLWTWAWGIQEASTNKEQAWEFVSWASSQAYEELVGEELGWARVPAGKRASTYENEQYLDVAGAFAEPAFRAIQAADPEDPGVQPRPAPGIQFMGIPEFPSLATQVSQDVSSAIAGLMTVDEALTKGQDLAEDVAERYQSREETA
jgi:sorbitol/mannitol transport system substrate-binding protein